MSDAESDYEETETTQKTRSKSKTNENENEVENEENDEETSVSGSETSSVAEATEDEDDDEDELDEDMDDIERIFDDDAGTSKKKTASKKTDVKSMNNDNLLNSIFGRTHGDSDNEDDENGNFADHDYEDAYDEEEYGFKYLQKFDNDTRKQIIDDFHREALQHSYEEIEAMCQIIRTEDGIVDALHRTPPFLTKYEKARILGERAKQLGAGAKPFIEVEESLIDEYTIAVLELQQGKLPFIIKRPLPNGGCEYWKLADLEILQ